MQRKEFINSLSGLMFLSTSDLLKKKPLPDIGFPDIAYRNLLVVGTRSGVGKNIVTSSLLKYFWVNKIKAVPFKPISIDRSLADSDNVPPTESVLIQSIAAGIQPSKFMNPIRIIFGSTSHTPNYYINGELQSRQYNFGNTATNKAIQNAYNQLKIEYPGVIVSEGSGGISDWFDNDFGYFIIELLNPLILLVADCSEGGEIAAIHGTLNLMPEKFKNRLMGIIINNLDKKSDSKFVMKCEEIAHVNSTQILGYYPTMLEIDALDENAPLQNIETIKEQLEYSSVVFKNHVLVDLILEKMSS